MGVRKMNWILVLSAICCAISANAEVVSEEAPPTCGKVLQAKDTTFSPPGAGTTSPNLNCTWTFNQTDETFNKKNIFITFSSLVMKHGDKFTIQGNKYSKTFDITLDTFTVMVDRSAVLNYLTSNVTSGLRGFTAYIKVNDCSETRTEGEVGRAVYPFFLSDSLTDTINCSWIFSKASSSVFALSFRTFVLADPKYTVTISSQSTPAINGQYTGKVLPPDSVAADITVSLSITKPDTKSYFEIDFVPVSLGCSQVREVSTSAFDYTPPQPLYPMYAQDCVMVLKNPNGKLKAHLTTNFLNSRDSIIINSGSGRFSPNMLTITQQGKTETEYVLSDDKYLWIQFSSDQVNGFSTFTLNVTPIDEGGLLRDVGFFNVKNTNQRKEVANGLLVGEGKQVSLNLNYSLQNNETVAIYDGLTGADGDMLLQLTDKSSDSFSIFSNSNEMLVVTTLDKNTSSVSASFNGKTTDKDCNVFSVQPTGLRNLMVPSNKTCTWLIKPINSPQNDVIALMIPPFKSQVTITLYEGISDTKTHLADISDIPVTGLSVHFDARKGAAVLYTNVATSKSDQSSVPAKYETMQSCGSTINLNENIEEISSPYYPNVYPMNVHCKWSIVLPQGKLAHVVFKDISTKPNENITIQESKNTYQFAGDDLPDDIITADNFTIEWSSLSTSANSDGRGFKISVQLLDCGGNYTDNSKNFSTPEYPHEPTTQTSCAWIINTSEDADHPTYIALQYAKQPLDKTKETVSFHDGGSVRDTMLTPTPDGKLTSKSSKLLITYDLAAKFNGSAYKFNYSEQVCGALKCRNGYCMQDKWICNGVNECGDNSDEMDCFPPTPDSCQDTKIINKAYTFTPDLSKKTSKAINCNWTFEAPGFSSLLITIESLDVANENDILKIEDPRDGNNSLHVSTFLLQSTGDYIITTGNAVTIHLFSSHLNSKFSNFKLKIQPQKIGKRLKVPTTIDIFFNATENETESFVLEAHDKVMFNIKKSEVHKLGKSKISLYDGTSKTTLLASFDNTTELYPVFSTSDEMLVVATPGDKLDLQVNASTVSGCYEFQTSPTGHFSTNSGPCYWLIKRPDDKEGVLFITVEALYEGSVTVFSELDDNKKSVIIRLNSSTPLPYTVHVPMKTGVRIEVQPHFEGKPSNKDSLVKINYEIIPECFSEYNLTSNVTLISPGYPHYYPYNAGCVWKINIPEKKLLHISFIDMDLERGHKVIIVENTTVHGKYEGRILPDDIIIDNTAFILWTSKNNNSNIGRGFKIFAEIIDCGGVFGPDQKSFSTPKQMNESTHCVWLVSVSDKDPKTKYTDIIKFNVDTEATYKNLEIHDGGLMSNKSLFFKSKQDELSRINKLVVIYMYEKYNKTKAPAVKFNYASYGCNETCANGICLKESWKCNNYNDCGDFTDEYNCTSASPTPTPTPTPAPSSGVSTGWFVGGIFLALALGVALALLIPMAIKKYKPHGGHQRLHNESDS